MSVVVYVGIGFSVVLLLILAVFLYFRMKGRKKYPFILFDNNLKSARIVYGVVKRDPENPANKKFFLEEADNPLEIKPPNFYLDGVPYRLIKYDRLSELKYLQVTGKLTGKSEDEIRKLKIDLAGKTRTVPRYIDGFDENIKRYVELSLLPEEKTTALYRLKENRRRYDDQISKTQAYLLVGGFVLALVIVIGVFVGTWQLVSNSKDMAAVAKETSKTVASLKDAASILEKVSEQNLAFISAVVGDHNVTLVRQLS